MNLTEIIIDELYNEAQRELKLALSKSVTPAQQGEHLYRVGKLLDTANEIREQLDSGKRVAEIGQFPEAFVKRRCAEEIDRVKWNAGGST